MSFSWAYILTFIWIYGINPQNVKSLNQNMFISCIQVICHVCHRWHIVFIYLTWNQHDFPTYADLCRDSKRRSYFGYYISESLSSISRFFKIICYYYGHVIKRLFTFYCALGPNAKWYGARKLAQYHSQSDRRHISQNTVNNLYLF